MQRHKEINATRIAAAASSQNEALTAGVAGLVAGAGSFFTFCARSAAIVDAQYSRSDAGWPL